MNVSDSSGPVLKDLERLSQSTTLLNLGNFGSGGGGGGAVAPLTPLSTPRSGGFVLYQLSKDHQKIDDCFFSKSIEIGRPILPNPPTNLRFCPIWTDLPT